MTDSIPVDQLGSRPKGDDGLRRDQYGRLLVVPPAGDQPVGYTRATTVAKTLDDGGGLMPWKSTMTACGLMRRPGLRAQWEALINAHNGDPWYAGEEAKAACKRLVEETATAGGATDRREQGTSLHAITAQHDRGQPARFLTPETEADVEAYVAELTKHSITVATLVHSGLPAVEVTVVLDDWGVGGSFDRLYQVPGYELPLIGDLKTGADLSYSWLAFDIQLAIYSRGDAIYVQGPDPTGAADTRESMPAVDQSHGLVVWLPAGAGRCELYVVNLDVGWEAFQLAMDVREIRRAGHVAAPFSQWAPMIVDVGEGLAEAPTSPDPSEEAAAPPPPQPSPPSVPTTGIVPLDEWIEIRAWLQERIDECGRHPTARQDLVAHWPAGVPTLGASVNHTGEQLSEIEGVLDMVELRNHVPFCGPKPGQLEQDYKAAITRLTNAFPGATVTESEEQS